MLRRTVVLGAALAALLAVPARAAPGGAPHGSIHGAGESPGWATWQSASPPPAVAQSAAATSVASGLIASSEPDWPQWRGPRRDGVSDERGLLRQWPDAGPPLLWKIDGLGTGWSSPIVVGDRVYVTGDVDGALLVFALDDKGRELWRAANGRSWDGPYPGARACPAYADGRLYHLNAHGRLACFDATDGRELWSADVLERFEGRAITWGLSECVLVDGPRVIVTPGGRKALMAALDRRDGRTLWTTPALGDDRASHASPILLNHFDRRLIVQCSSHHGLGVDAETGQLLWTVPLRNRYGVNTATPAYAAGCVYYVTPYGEEGRCYRLEAAAGGGIDARQLWACPLDTVTGSSIVIDGALYAGGYKRSKWWFALDWATGQTRSESKDFTTGAAVYADGRLYVFDERGAVGLIDPGPERMTTVGRFQLLGPGVRDAWAHPVVCRGRLYLRHHDALWCFDVAAQTCPRP